LVPDLSNDCIFETITGATKLNFVDLYSSPKWIP